MEIFFEIKSNYYLVKLSCEFDHELAQSYFDDILWNCKLNNITRILIDFREITGYILTGKRAMAGFAGVKAYKTYFESNVDEFKIAIIGREWFLKGPESSATPATDALRAAGIDVMLTHNHSKALDWVCK
jgi:hypothetical protein